MAESKPAFPSAECPHLKFMLAEIQDIPELVTLWYQVFEDPAIRAIWPDTPGVRQWWDATIRHDMLNKPRERYLKVVDTSRRGAIVAWGKWSLQTAEERGPRYLPWHQDMDAGHNDAYFRDLEASRARLVGGGRNNFYGDMLAVLPEYRKLGLALAIMKWGCHEADVANVPSYLDATVAGSRVYEKLDFVAAQDGPTGLISMVRKPKRADIPKAML